MRYLHTFILVMLSITFQAQNFGEIKGKVLDAVTGEPVAFANVWVETGTVPIGAYTDDDGRFRIKPLSPGTYDLHVKDVRYTAYVQQGVVVSPNEITVLPEISLAANTLGEIKVVTYTIPLIDKDNPSKMTIGSADLKHRSDVRDTRTMISRLVPAVKQNAEGDQLFFKGARPYNIATFIDGVKVGAGEVPRIPSNAINNLTVYTGGIPACYGDVTGGVIVIETKGYMDFYRESQRRKRQRTQRID
ncbi:MAG: TonB-dependent receptor [Flavobacteriales bacterium]|nr:TonB-dependent receptor [Flavobacteriales bacterium]